MKKRRILIVDGQGGGIGRQLAENIKSSFPDAIITAVGTNILATKAMMKAGADEAATGENAVLVACKRADIIVGPVGIVIADSLMGEITPKMAVAVGQASAIRILLPLNQCDNLVAGVENLTMSHLVKSCIDQIRQSLDRLDE